MARNEENENVQMWEGMLMVTK